MTAYDTGTESEDIHIFGGVMCLAAIKRKSKQWHWLRNETELINRKTDDSNYDCILYVWEDRGNIKHI